MLASNVGAVNVFCLARGDYLMGFGAAVYHGVAAVESQAVAAIIGVECDEDLLWRVRVLEGAYGETVNNRARRSQSC